VHDQVRRTRERAQRFRPVEISDEKPNAALHERLVGPARKCGYLVAFEPARKRAPADVAAADDEQAFA